MENSVNIQNECKCSNEPSSRRTDSQKLQYLIEQKENISESIIIKCISNASKRSTTILKAERSKRNRIRRRYKTLPVLVVFYTIFLVQIHSNRNSK